MQIVTIMFSDVCSNVKKFEITGLGPKVEDTVRINDAVFDAPPSREALSIYNFWFDVLKDLIKKYGKHKLRLVCNDLPLLRRYHESYCRESLRNDPWPFEERA